MLTNCYYSTYNRTVVYYYKFILLNSEIYCNNYSLFVKLHPIILV